ncbi:MAG: hypothetical protein WBX01_05585 [Nitrososphaeraceae archaeon]
MNFQDASLKLDEILKKHTQILTEMAKLNKKRLPSGRESIRDIIKMSFAHRNQPQNQVCFLYGHWTMCKESLLFLTKYIISATEKAIKEYTRYSSPHEDLNSRSELRNRRIAFANWIKYHQNLQGLIQNVIQMLKEYEYIFSNLCKEIDPRLTYNDQSFHQSTTQSFEFLGAVEELLLRGEYGREAGFPLLRSGLEIMIREMVFDTTNSLKHKNKTVEIRDNEYLGVENICGAASQLGMEKLSYCNIVSRLYKWESIVSHRGLNVSYYILWYVLNITRHEFGSVFWRHNKDRNVIECFDKIRDRLETMGIITIS